MAAFQRVASRILCAMGAALPNKPWYQPFGQGDVGRNARMRLDRVAQWTAKAQKEGSGEAAKTDNRIGASRSPLTSLVPGPKRDLVVTAQPIPIRRFRDSWTGAAFPHVAMSWTYLKETARTHPNRMRLFLRSDCCSPGKLRREVG